MCCNRWRSGFKGVQNVNCGRVLVIRPLILLLEELDCWDVKEEVDLSFSAGGGGSYFLDIVGCICGCVIVVLLVNKLEGF